MVYRIVACDIPIFLPTVLKLNLVITYCQSNRIRMLIISLNMLRHLKDVILILRRNAVVLRLYYRKVELIGFDRNKYLDHLV